MKGSGGNRLAWEQAPTRMRVVVEELAGSRVVEARDQSGGFSPGLAARLRLDDGRWVFAKAIAADVSETGAALHRAEARIAGALPPDVPAPRLLGSYDDGQLVALLFALVDGRQPHEPWRPDELGRVLDAMTVLATMLTPAPIQVPSLVDTFGGPRRWRDLAEAPADQDAVAAVSRWAVDHLATLTELESRWPSAAAGQTLLHCDVRADNVLLTEDDVVFVDWPHARVGAAYLDLLFMLPSAALHGVDPEAVAATHPLTRSVDPDDIDAVLATIAAFFVFHSIEPPPPGLPTVRKFQRLQGAATVEWLARRLAARR